MYVGCQFQIGQYIMMFFFKNQISVYSVKCKPKPEKFSWTVSAQKSCVTPTGQCAKVDVGVQAAPHTSQAAVCVFVFVWGTYCFYFVFQLVFL